MVEYMVRNLSFITTCDFQSDYISNDIPPLMNILNMVTPICTLLEGVCLVFINKKRENI